MSEKKPVILKCNKWMADWGKHYLMQHRCTLDEAPTYHDLLTCPDGTTVESAVEHQTFEPRYRYTLPDGAWFIGQYLRARANPNENGNYVLFLPQHVVKEQR